VEGGELARKLTVGAREPARLQRAHLQIGRDAGALRLETLAILLAGEQLQAQRLHALCALGERRPDVCEAGPDGVEGPLLGLRGRLRLARRGGPPPQLPRSRRPRLLERGLAPSWDGAGGVDRL